MSSTESPIRNTKKKLSSSSDDLKAVSPFVFWMKLYSFQSKNLIKTIKRVLARDISLYREILTKLEYDAEAVKHVKVEDVKKDHWLIAYDEDDIVHVADNSDAQKILDELYKNYNLPKRNSYGRKIKKVTGFDQLIAQMTLFSLEYILELTGYVFRKDKTRRYKIRDYEGFNNSVEEDELRDLLGHLGDK